MALAPRDERPIHDQIIDHGLAQLGPEQIMKLHIVELRKLREAIAVLTDRLPEKPDKD